MSRRGPQPDRITVARLTGTATRLARDRYVDEQSSVAELVSIATEYRRGVGPRVRVDLLSEAAGSLLGGHRHDATSYWSGAAAARLLLAAGADPDLVEQHAAETVARLRTASRPGIGNPN